MDFLHARTATVSALEPVLQAQSLQYRRNPKNGFCLANGRRAFPLPREDLLNGVNGGRPRPITQRRRPHRLRRIREVSHEREPKNLSNMARRCGAVRSQFDRHWMGHFYDEGGSYVEVPAGRSRRDGNLRHGRRDPPLLCIVARLRIDLLRG